MTSNTLAFTDNEEERGGGGEYFSFTSLCGAGYKDRYSVNGGRVFPCGVKKMLQKYVLFRGKMGKLFKAILEALYECG